MNTETTKKAFYKRPIFFIFLMFLVIIYNIQRFATYTISDDPLVLSRANPPEIIMYGTESCKYCYYVKSFFDKHNLPFVEHDIERSEKHMDMFRLLGGTGTPLVIINKEIIHGFNERAMRKAL